MVGSQSVSRAFRDPRMIVGGILIVLIAALALLAPWIAPNDPQEQNLLATLQPPVWATGGEWHYPLGTDTLGRCIASRLIYGARIALYVAFFAASGAMIIGTAMAVVAAYFGGLADWIISRIVDIWMAFPPVVLALILLVGLGVGVNKVVIAIVLIDWTRFCRVVRSEALAVMMRDYIAAARLAGFTHWQVMTKELLPAIAPLVITLMSLSKRSCPSWDCRLNLTSPPGA
jgi:peptide/nickel transport system permease protein